MADDIAEKAAENLATARRIVAERDAYVDAIRKTIKREEARGDLYWVGYLSGVLGSSPVPVSEEQNK